MEFLLSNFTGDIINAITIGLLIGVAAGIVWLGAPNASERTGAIIAGILIGGIAMAVFQGLRIGGVLGLGFGSSVNPLIEAQVGTTGAMLYQALIRTAQAALVGGVLVVFFVAPRDSFVGGLGGAAIGGAAGAISWGLLELVDATIPYVLFLLMILAIILAAFDVISTRS